MSSLLLFRGVQGSGKSTVADMLERYETPYYTASTIEADKFRNYTKPFDPILNSKAHQWCKLEVERMMVKELETIFCANTFCKEWEIKPYRELCDNYGYRLFIIRVEGDHRNVHNVPDDVVAQFKEKFEDVEGEIIFDNSQPMMDCYDLVGNERLFYLRQGLIHSGVNARTLRFITPPDTEVER